MTPDALRFVIREGRARDIDACLALDHTYTTDGAWQVRVAEEPDGYAVLLRHGNHPRTASATHPPDAERLRHALDGGGCLLVAQMRDEGPLLGYLVAHITAHRVGVLHDVVVSLDYRRRGLGLRLVRAARRWAQENSLVRLNAHVRTKNIPAVALCQRSGFRMCGYNDMLLGDHDIALLFGQALDGRP